MLLDNIRHLKAEVEKTNQEIKKARHERLYGNMMEDEIRMERELPYGSRFFHPKIPDIEEATTTKTMTTGKHFYP